MTARTLGEAVAAQAGRSDAHVVFGTSVRRETIGYAEFGDQIAAAAGGFAEQGVRPSDRVMIRIESTREAVVALLGLVHLGAVPVSVKPKVPGAITRQYLAMVARQQGIRHTFRIPGQGLRELDLVLRRGVVREPAAAAPEDLAFVQYTSGSTGMPRPIPLSHRALLGNIEAIRGVSGMKRGHAGLIALPLHHDMGLVGVLTSLVYGIDLVVESSGTFLRRPMAALQLLRDTESVHSALPDFMLRYLAARIGEAARQGAPDPELFGAWRTVFCGAEPIRRRTVDTFLDAVRPWGFDPTSLVFCYGLAEATLMATSHRYVDASTSFSAVGAVDAACLGVPVPGLDLRIVDESGRGCAPGATGAVQLRGPTLFDGYDGATDHRTSWFDTGDLGHVRSGRLYLSGRHGDRISVNGVNVFATDIEQVVAALEPVAEAVVLPHGESFAVLVVPERARVVDTASVAAGIAADFGVAPHSVIEVPRSAITRTASGKPARTHMTEQFEKGLL